MKRSDQDLDLHIHQIEERLAARRAHLTERVDEVGTATRSLVLSPGMLTAAASVGFALAQMSGRRKDVPKTKRSRLLGLLTTAGLMLIKSRYGSPASWVGKLLSRQVRG